MSKINCPVCDNSEAEIRTTKPKADAKRRMSPKAFLWCPECGSLNSNKKQFGERLTALVEKAQQKADLSGEQKPVNPTVSDKKDNFFSWGVEA